MMTDDTIPVTCPNGHKIRAKASLAGRQVPCPACKQVVQVPSPDAFGDDESDDDAASTTLRPPRTVAPWVLGTALGLLLGIAGTSAFFKYDRTPSAEKNALTEKAVSPAVAPKPLANSGYQV